MQDRSKPGDRRTTAIEGSVRAAATRLMTLTLAVGLALMLAPGRPLTAQETPPAAEAQTPAGNAPAGNAPAGNPPAGQRTPPAAGADEAAAPAGASESRAAGDEEDDFRPSEEVLPEDQVVFPVDI